MKANLLSLPSRSMRRQWFLEPVAQPLATLFQGVTPRLEPGDLFLQNCDLCQLGTLLQRKEVPFFFEGSAAYFNDADYFFRIFYHGTTRWNFGSYNNPEFAALVDKTRYETNQEVYERDVRRMIELANEEGEELFARHEFGDDARRQGWRLGDAACHFDAADNHWMVAFV